MLDENIFFILTIFPSPIATDKNLCVEDISAVLRNDINETTPAIRLYNPKSSTPSTFNTTLVRYRAITVVNMTLKYNISVFPKILFAIFI